MFLKRKNVATHLLYKKIGNERDERVVDFFFSVSVITMPANFQEYPEERRGPQEKTTRRQVYAFVFFGFVFVVIPIVFYALRATFNGMGITKDSELPGPRSG
jgi:hypothetical protein